MRPGSLESGPKLLCLNYKVQTVHWRLRETPSVYLVRRLNYRATLCELLKTEVLPYYHPSSNSDTHYALLSPRTNGGTGPSATIRNQLVFDN